MLAVCRWRTEDDVSAGSKIGLWSADDVELALSWSEDEQDSKYSSSDSFSSSSCVLNFPPWIGGKKFVQRPSIRPI